MNSKYLAVNKLTATMVIAAGGNEISVKRPSGNIFTVRVLRPGYKTYMVRNCNNDSVSHWDSLLEVKEFLYGFA
jgi:hypothetical protein